MVAPTLAMLYPTLLLALSQSNYTIFPDEEGQPHLIKLDYEPLSSEEVNTLAADVNSVTFTLFTRLNPTNGQRLSMNDLNAVAHSNWKSQRPTVICTHGWKSSGTKPVCTLTRDAYLKAMDANVIVVDWSDIAGNIIYSQVAKSVPTVAQHVANFVNFLRTKSGLRTSTLKMVGHSLGAHVMSLSARIVTKSSPVAEVIALDPAKPMFESNGPDGRVDRSHAKNVQVIHTSAGKLGMDGAVGTSDFYANGGTSQPGCNTDMLGSCAHGRSYEYFSESIKHPRGFPGKSKSNGKIAYMGGPNLDPNAHGAYDFKTGSSPPYLPA